MTQEEFVQKLISELKENGIELTEEKLEQIISKILDQSSPADENNGDNVWKQTNNKLTTPIKAFDIFGMFKEWPLSSIANSILGISTNLEKYSQLPDDASFFKDKLPIAASIARDSVKIGFEVVKLAGIKKLITKLTPTLLKLVPVLPGIAAITAGGLFGYRQSKIAQEGWDADDAQRLAEGYTVPRAAESGTVNVDNDITTNDNSNVEIHSNSTPESNVYIDVPTTTTVDQGNVYPQNDGRGSAPNGSTTESTTEVVEETRVYIPPNQAGPSVYTYEVAEKNLSALDDTGIADAIDDFRFAFETSIDEHDAFLLGLTTSLPTISQSLVTSLAMLGIAIGAGVQKLHTAIENLNVNVLNEVNIVIGNTGNIELASGGLVHSETDVTVGEYLGASTNPEVVAPLDKLRGIMQNDFMLGMNAYMAQHTQPLRLDAVAAGVAATPRNINQVNNFNQSFTCTDRAVQATADRAMQGSVYNAEAELARAIRNQR